MSRMSRTKGQRIEREIVALHKDIGVYGERVPLSGAAKYKGGGHDVDVYVFGRDEVPLCCEVKARKDGAGFKTLEGWLADNQALFLRRNYAKPLVVLPWETWVQLVGKPV